jgi:threonine dehydrogenase-like Zn-dependent dehydrogenase
MKAAIFRGPGQITVEEVADPVIQNPDEAIVKVSYSCICGSDLWDYRGLTPRETGSRIGHEFMGIVEAVGSQVQKIKVGDLVIVPFNASCGSCPHCRLGLTFSCYQGKSWGHDGFDGGQGEKVRVPLADGTLQAIPLDQVRPEQLPALMPLADVLCTGHHAAVCAGVQSGLTVAIIGDGAVGLCAVAASHRLGASRIFLISTHPDRAAIGQQFGATDIIAVRHEEAIKQIQETTKYLGVDCALECVGTPQSWQTVLGVVRQGGNVGAVGIPHDAPDIRVEKIFWPNIGVKGGLAPVAHYIPQLLPDVLANKLNVSAIFTKTISLDEIASGYEDMDQRRQIKILIKM